MTSIPVVTQPLDDLNVAESANNTTLDLTQSFDDPLTTGKVARFELADSSLGGGITNVLLFDQEGAGTPATVANFTSYVEDGDYVNSIIHRSVPGFVIQGGGFTFDGEQFGEVPTDPPVVNEFSSDRSNLRGTIAMAKLGGDPDSATSQWFFNLADNSQNLDGQNGGFTVFGEVLSEADLAPVDAIAELTIVNGTNVNPAFSSLPVTIGEDNIQNPIVYENITISQVEELEFEVVSNSNPDLVNLSIDGGELVLDYADNVTGTAEITIQATDLLGDSVQDTFVITVGDTETGGDGNSDDIRGETVYRFLNNDTGVHLYTASTIERDDIIDTLPNYVFEGASYVGIDELSGNPEPAEVYRFLNRDTGTHLYTTSEVEKSDIESRLSNFTLEEVAFYAYTEEQPNSIPIYRFYNNETGAHFYTPSTVERDVVRDTLPNYESEGIAYYAFPTEDVV